MSAYEDLRKALLIAKESKDIAGLCAEYGLNSTAISLVLKMAVTNFWKCILYKRRGYPR